MTEPDELNVEGWPAAFRRLGVRRRSIPFIQQLSATECGAACLTMVLAYHGKVVRLEEVREACAVDRNGVNALTLRDAARLFGLRGRGVAVDIDELELLLPGTILHWEFDHFVVFERLRKGFVEIVDPAVGRRRIPLPQFRKSFTGVALLLEPSDDLDTGARVDHRMWRLMRIVLRQSRLLPRILVMSLLIQVFALSVPLFTGQLIDRVAPRGDRHLLGVLVVGAVAMVAFNLFAALVRSNLLLHLRTVLDARLTVGFLEHLVGLPYSYFQLRSAGDLMMRLSSNSIVREILTSGVLSALLDGTLVVGYLVMLLVVNSTMGAIVLAVAAVNIAVMVLAQSRQRELVTGALQAEAKLNSYQVEMLTGIETLKAMGCESRSVDRWSNLFVDVLNVSLQRGRLSALVEAVLSSLRLAAPLVILTGGALLVIRNELSLGTMLALGALGGSVLTPISSLVGTGMQLQLLRSYLDRLNDVLETEPEQPRDRPVARRRIKGQITLRDVSFRYGPLAPYVVKDVSVSIEPGDFVAVVGPSGGGKSTLAALMLGLYRPTSGQILYDGIELGELDLRATRRQMGIVIQNDVLFAGTIRDNIALADSGMSLGDVIGAAKLAGIHDEIAAMPLGYHTPLVDRGGAISGGQRQRLALARALARRPAIMLLDEATSALDTLNESRIHQALVELRCTRIVVAHRLSTIVRADTILVMDEGRIVEAGRHGELLRGGGLYQRLVASQIEPAPQL